MCNVWRKEVVKSKEKAVIQKYTAEKCSFEANTCEAVPTSVNTIDFKVRRYYRKVEIFHFDIFLAKWFNILFQSYSSFYS